jgi:hypothetical protein
MSVGEKSVIFLLGAGCSYDATVPVSKVMIEKLESLLESSHNDDLFPLYNYVNTRWNMEITYLDKNRTLTLNPY